MKNTVCPAHFAYYPAVYAVENTYQIRIPVRTPSVMWITVGDRSYFDAVGGVMRSGTLYHKITVPMEALDAAGGYTIRWREVRERRAYCSLTQEMEECFFAFRPVPAEGAIRACHITDAHGRKESPVRAVWTAVAAERPDAETVTDGLDLIFLTGDLPNHAGDEEQFRTIPAIASALSHGEIPIVFARGNHDTRGAFAEHLGDVCPTVNERYYYTFRLGRIWGLVLDLGEDKPDDHEEYNFVNCFADYRREEEEFLLRVIREKEYLSDGIETRIVVCHFPFPFPLNPPFNIETDRYSRWAKRIGKEIRPDLMISGHLHAADLCPIGYSTDFIGKDAAEYFGFGRYRPERYLKEGTKPEQFCPILLSGAISDKPEEYVAGALTISEDGTIRVRFADSEGRILIPEPAEIKKNGRGSDVSRLTDRH